VRGKKKKEEFKKNDMTNLFLMKFKEEYREEKQKGGEVKKSVDL
jgi:hypothetical protein